MKSTSVVDLRSEFPVCISQRIFATNWWLSERHDGRVSAYEKFDWTMRELNSGSALRGKATGKTKQPRGKKDDRSSSIIAI
jgi:hypothetical protein